jgi:hypothetical protein
MLRRNVLTANQQSYKKYQLYSLHFYLMYLKNILVGARSEKC